MIRTPIIILLLMLPSIGIAQVMVRGRLIGPERMPVSSAFVTSKKLQRGVITNDNGEFFLNVPRKDTLIISGLGYYLRTEPLPVYSDSVVKLEIMLFPKAVALREFTVTAPRTLEEMREDIREYKPYEYSVQGLGAVRSPVTFLYERFSKRERSKRLVSEWEAEDLRKDALKELLAVYVDKNIINLKDEEYSEFLSFLNLSDDFLLNASEYELVVAIKERYRQFLLLKR